MTRKNQKLTKLNRYSPIGTLGAMLESCRPADSLAVEYFIEDWLLPLGGYGSRGGGQRVGGVRRLRLLLRVWQRRGSGGGGDKGGSAGAQGARARPMQGRKQSQGQGARAVVCREWFAPPRAPVGAGGSL